MFDCIAGIFMFAVIFGIMITGIIKSVTKGHNVPQTGCGGCGGKCEHSKGRGGE
ncbi:MAG: hypothetical protein H8D23_11065 [Candidatus Brocadiales bacterium]|nr:hypothetical protein [Candidatus Brocadiales bacterium]